jgi:hypothetical protein
MTPPPDVTACAGAQVVVNFSGDPANGFSWTNSNTAIGLGASGTGNLNFTAAQVAQTETATVTVTPLYGDCEGDPVEFDITINPGPEMDDPADLSVCAGQPVSVIFSGEGTGFSWANSNTAIGLGASGTGNLNFTAANVGTVQTGNITVTPTGGACPGYPETFTISVLPLPTAVQPPNVTACAGANVAVNFSGAAGAGFSWTNTNPNIGLPPNGVDNLNFTAANVAQTEVATLTVTPILAGCPGPPKTFQITIKPLPVMDAPPDLTVCGETEVVVEFTGPAGATFAWTNTNPAIGLPASGTGNIAFTANNSPLPQTAVVAVTPTLSGCAGQPYSFEINVLPAPVMNDSPNLTVCESAPVSVVFSGTAGASFVWENTNPAIGLPSNGSGPLISFTAANVMDTTIGTITVTPVKGICTGQPQTFNITVVNCCATFAGDLDTNFIAVCGLKTVKIIHLGNQNLEPNDTIRYILFSNPADPLGSIVQYSDTLYFPFLQGIMNFDSAYFAAAVAGNQLANNSIDPADPCFSMSKKVKILWRQKPTISVGSPPAAVCKNGCADVLFEFTGAPPFQFTWLVVEGGQILLTKNEISPDFQFLVTVCTADLSPPPTGGSINFQVNFLMDKFCGCVD